MLTAIQIKTTYLNGMPLADQFGRPLPDSVIEGKMLAAKAALQRRLGIRFEPTLIKMGLQPFRAPNWPTALPKLELDAMAYDPRSFEGNRHAYLKLPIGPVQSVYKVGLHLPGTRELLEWQPQWVQLSKRQRMLQIYPFGTQFNLFPLHASGIGMMALATRRSIPASWHVVYQGGCTADDLAGDYADLLEALGMLSAIGTLVPGSIDKYAALGISGLSANVDGLSNSTQMAGGGNILRHAAVIEAYKEKLAEWEKAFMAHTSGIRMVMV